MIDKQFFDTFGIKPKKGCTAYDKFTILYSQDLQKLFKEV